MNIKWIFSVFLGGVLISGSVLAAGTGAVINADSPAAIPGAYIVVFKPGLTAEADVGPLGASLAQTHGGSVGAIYTHIFHGFSAQLGAAAALSLSRDPRVAYVEQAQHFQISGIQYAPDWGLDRMDQRALPLENAYRHRGDGSSAYVFVVDTGIRLSHLDFGGRAIAGYDFFSTFGVDYCPALPPPAPPGTQPQTTALSGHATHVGGTVGGTTYGVAKNVTLVDVRVFSCWGYSAVANGTDSILWGLDRIAGDSLGLRNLGPTVVNMSFGGPHSPAMNDAVRTLINLGFVPVIAAGNWGSAQCLDTRFSPAPTVSPADVNITTDGIVSAPPVALVVGATTNTDSVASFSNQGACVNIFAPGKSIVSDWDTSDTATGMLDGTSMATPHVAGEAAIYLQFNPHVGVRMEAVATDTHSYLTGTATLGALTGVAANTPNALVFGFGPPLVSLEFLFCSPTNAKYLGSWSSATSSVSYDMDLQPYGSLGWQDYYDGGMTVRNIAVGLTQTFRIRVRGTDSLGEQSDFTYSDWYTANCSGPN
ncbi:MAG: S8 family peptidase [Gammaproteobacteria bacterium]|nr:S8 family peptidase [Gammaproteobacteria bacterium]